MKKRLGFQRVTEDQAIADFLRSLDPQVRSELSARTQAARELWIEEAFTNQYPKPSEQELFTPHDHSIASQICLIDGSKTLVTRKGFWSLQLPIANRFSQFTITVKVGDVHRFKPYDIKRSFRQWYSENEWQDRYLHWKQLVLADLDSARELIETAEPFEHLASMTCCESAERLCRRIGLRVENGLAYLFRKDSIAQPAANKISRLSRKR